LPITDLSTVARTACQTRARHHLRALLLLPPALLLDPHNTWPAPQSDLLHLRGGWLSWRAAHTYRHWTALRVHRFMFLAFFTGLLVPRLLQLAFGLVAVLPPLNTAPSTSAYSCMPDDLLDVWLRLTHPLSRRNNALPQAAFRRWRNMPVAQAALRQPAAL